MMKVTQLVLLLITITIANNYRSHLASLMKSKKNFIKKNNENLHNILNQILESLNVDANFTARAEIQLLLTMHFGLTNIAEKTCEVYEQFKNTIKVTDNKTINKNFILHILNEILNETPFKLKIIDKIFQVTEDKIGTKDIKSEEVKELTNDYLMKLNILNIKELVDKSTEDEASDDDDTSAPNINLKVWDTSSYEISSETRRVHNGVQTKVQLYPFIASIHVMGDFICAGSIISTNLVITAASCLHIAYNTTHYKQNTGAIVIRVGSDYLSRGGKVLPVLEIFFHPSYDPVHLWNNLAIIRIQRRLRFSKKSEKIRRILVNNNSEILPRKADKVTVLGWGAKDEGQTLDPLQIISFATLEIYDIEKCKDIYSRDYVTDKHFCASFLRGGGGACNGDIGAPGVINKFLSGVVSFASPTCGAPNSPTVFTNLGYYAHWIEQILEKDQRSDKTSFTRTVATKSGAFFIPSTHGGNIKTKSTDPEVITKSKRTVNSNEISVEHKNNTREVHREDTWVDISDNYEQEFSTSIIDFNNEVPLNARDKEGAANSTSLEVANITDANISEMNMRYSDDNVYI